MYMEGQLNVGIIGFGRIGLVHAENITHRLPNVVIRGVADTCLDDEMVDAAKRLNINYQTESYADLLALPEIHAIFICSPTSTHHDIVLDCLRAKKHVFCEKPVSDNIRKLSNIITELEKCENAKLKFQVGFNRRFDHNFRAIKKLIDSKQLGQPYILRITSRDPCPPSFDYLKLSGGLLFDMTIHDFDMARYLLDDDIIQVDADGSILFDNRLHQIKDIDTAVITMKTLKGTFVLIDNSRQATYGYDQRVEIFGSLGQATISNDTNSSVVLWNNDGVHSEKPLRFFVERYREAYLTEIKEFVNSVLYDQPVSATIYDALEALKLSRAAQLSFKEKRRVNITEISQ